MRLAGVISRVILMGTIGAGTIALLTWWTQHDPRMSRDAFAYGYCMFSAVLDALFCGLMSAYQIHMYLHPETER
jgi:hypothetical protein